MDTEALRVLVNAVSAGSIAAAARRMDLDPLVASRRLAGLERELGVRLLQRTTRSLSLTPEGEDFLPHARDILDGEAAALAALSPEGVGAAGLLRVTAPAALGREVIIPLLPALFAANPQLRLELDLNERLVDVVGEGFDVAVRIAELRDTALVARRLGAVRRWLCASPDYVRRRGSPALLTELAQHDCLPLVGGGPWRFDTAKGVERVRVSGRLACSTIEGVHAACRQGLGVAMLASWSAAEDVAAGRLMRLSLDAEPHAPPVSAIYPAARVMTPKLRVFLAALGGALRGV